ncbi:hypothetical protein H0H93_015088 [Arthromyces matolae]|nr:hypothetical protein H0H93_015088 [Arthromyces matolae]
MSFSADHPLLVAPRPIRLGAAYHAVLSNRVRLPDSTALDVALDKDLPSQRSSPRSALPSEALEEFLSILRPSLFAPSSPVLRARRQATSFTQDHRSYGFQSRNRRELLSDSNSPSDDLDHFRSQQPSRNSICNSPDSINEDETILNLENEGISLRRYKTNILSSPVSRTHTRNPFLRHAADRSPVLIPPLSPAAIPLPQPTPDELGDISYCVKDITI